MPPSNDDPTEGTATGDASDDPTLGSEGGVT